MIGTLDDLTLGFYAGLAPIRDDPAGLADELGGFVPPSCGDELTAFWRR